MAELIPASDVERMVNARRHATEHIGLASSMERKTFLLHSQACKDTGIDLRRCEFALAQDAGIDEDVWDGREDHPYFLRVMDGQLVPLKRATPLEVCTDLSASWCPIHGDCTCDREESLDRWDCPLHSPDATHPEK